MKTNVNMVRKLNEFDVIQRTKDGMFYATKLLKQYNKKNGTKKEIKKFFENDNTKEFIQVLEKEEGLNRQNPAYLKKRGKLGGTWLHPILFVKFATWLSPEFEYHIIKFVYDKMIEFRIDSGNSFKEMTDAIKEKYTAYYDADPNPEIYKNEINFINELVFGVHAYNQKNKATTDQLDLISKLQNANTKMIKLGKSVDWRKNSLTQLKDLL